MDLSDRQKQLLLAIIQEFMDTADAVGSINLPEKYELGISPATVRNEMMLLTKYGLIRKAHASSGRIPTSVGLKYFVSELLEDMTGMNVETEVKVRQDIFQNRFSADHLLYEAVHKLSDLTGNAGVAVYLNRVYYAGISSMVDFPEYHEHSQLKELLSILEDYQVLAKVFEKSNSDDDVNVLIGEEDIGYETFEKAAIVFAPLRLHRKEKGFLSVIGPNRMNYAKVIPTVKWMADTINQSVIGW